MGTIALLQHRCRKLEFQDPISFHLIEHLFVESLQGGYGYNLASITSSVSHLTCCFYSTTCFCGPVLFAKVLGSCQTLCTPGKVFKSLSAAADLSSGLQLKAQVLSYFIVAAAETTDSRERPRLRRKFHRNLLACSVRSSGKSFSAGIIYVLTAGNLSSVPVTINHINILQMPNVLTCCLWFQVEGTPKKHVAEEFEEFDYSDLYEDLSISTVTAGPNVTDYEVRLTIGDCLSFSLHLLSFPVSVFNPKDHRV